MSGTLAVTLPVPVVRFTGVYTGASPTDTSNGDNGRIRNARATVTITRPAAAVPPGQTFGIRYDKAIVLPVPTMVDGRAT